MLFAEVTVWELEVKRNFFVRGVRVPVERERVREEVAEERT